MPAAPDVRRGCDASAIPAGATARVGTRERLKALDIWMEPEGAPRLPDKTQTSPSKAELFELIVESAADFAIFTIDPRRIVTSWNVGAQRQFATPNRNAPAPPPILFSRLKTARSMLLNAKTAQASLDGSALDERWHQRKDGARFWASGLLVRLRDADRGFVKISRDRTEQHEASRRLRETRNAFAFWRPAFRNWFS